MLAGEMTQFCSFKELLGFVSKGMSQVKLTPDRDESWATKGTWNERRGIYFQRKNGVQSSKKGHRLNRLLQAMVISKTWRFTGQF